MEFDTKTVSCSAIPPPRLGGGPSLRKNFGSLTLDMNRLGCAASAACRAVVPALGAPMMKKSGKATGETSSAEPVDRLIRLFRLSL